MAATTNNTTWETPRTWSTGELVTASMLNTHLKGNLNALHVPAGGYNRINLGADITTASTSFTDVDTEFSITCTTGGGDVLVCCMGNITNSGAGTRNYLDIHESVAAARYGLDDGLLLVHSAGSTVANPFTLLVRIPSLSAASHTFKLQWKVSSGTATLYAGAGTSNFDLHPTMFVVEI